MGGGGRLMPGECSGAGLLLWNAAARCRRCAGSGTVCVPGHGGARERGLRSGWRGSWASLACGSGMSRQQILLSLWMRWSRGGGTRREQRHLRSLHRRGRHVPRREVAQVDGACPHPWILGDNLRSGQTGGASPRLPGQRGAWSGSQRRASGGGCLRLVVIEGKAGEEVGGGSFERPSTVFHQRSARRGEKAVMSDEQSSLG